MGKITCYDALGEPLTHIYQWDSNRTIIIPVSNPSIVTEVHFCNVDSERALVVSPSIHENGVCAVIPNILLQNTKPIIIYTHSISDEFESKTIEAFRIVVIAKPKPSNYVYSETEIFSYKNLEEDVKKITREMEELERDCIGNVKSVNGVEPDEGGNVEITIPDWAMQEKKPTYTAIDVGALPDDTEIPVIPTNVSAFENDAGYITEHQSLDGYAKTEDIPTDDHINNLINTALGTSFEEIDNLLGGDS